MHKRLLNEAILEWTIQPTGPILIKAGESGADPTHPDMEFVRTRRNGIPTVYLPGSSLKGIIRAQCERIVRSVGADRPGTEHAVWSCDPLSDDGCSQRLEASHKAMERQGEWTGAGIYSTSCFVCQMFGHTSLAGHVRTADAYPQDAERVRIEERNGVAIDRVFGSVKVGPFNYEVVTEGIFQTRLYVKNFTLAQLGLLALALRDLKLGRVRVGFAKSRGLGSVTAGFERCSLRYPTAVLNGGMSLPGCGEVFCQADEIAGVGAFQALIAEDYGYPNAALEVAGLPDGVQLQTDRWYEVVAELEGEAQVEALWADACVPAWRRAAGLA